MGISAHTRLDKKSMKDEFNMNHNLEQKIEIYWIRTINWIYLQNIRILKY